MRMPLPYCGDRPVCPKKKGLLACIACLYRNIRLLSRYCLKDIMSDTYIDLSNYAYEIKDIASRVSVPVIHDPVETLKMLVSSSKSFIRIGDGELKILEGEGIPFQNADPLLAKRLSDAITQPVANLEIGFSWVYFHPDTVMQQYLRAYNWKYLRTNKDVLLKYIDESREYYAAEITQLYQMFSDSFDFAGYFDIVRKIWDRKDIVLVCGNRTFNDIEYNIFDNAASVVKVEGPSTNAFSVYDSILENVKRVSSSKMVVVILGPAGKVLTYDLARFGIRALDMGHIAKDYNAYKTHAPKDWAALFRFFSPEL